MIGKWHLGQRSGRLRSLGDPARAGRLHEPAALHRDGREDLHGPIRDRRHHRPRDRLHREAAAQQAVLPDAAPQGAAPAVGAGCQRTPRSSRTRRIPEPDDAVGLLRDAHRCASREPAARRGGPDAARSQARRRRRTSPARSCTSWLATKPDTVTIVRDGKTVTLTGEALARWKYQRYMQDYLATVQSVDDNVGRLLDSLDREGLAKNTIVIYTSDQGFFLGDHGHVRQAVHVRGIAAHAVPRPLAGRHQARDAERRDRAERRLRADVPRRRGHCRRRRRCRAAACCRCCAAARPRTGARRCTTATTTIPAITTRARTTACARTTHKLIYFWKKDQWELFDLVNDPHELHNLYGEPGQEAADRDAEGRARAAEAGGRATTISSPTSSCRTASTVRSRSCAGSERDVRMASLL